MENEKNEQELKDELLALLFKDAELPMKSDLSEKEKDNFLRALFLTRAEVSVEEKLLNVQNKYCRLKNENAIERIDNLKFKHNIAYSKNILDLDCDMVVLITENLLENINALAANDLDNDLILKAGLEFKVEMLKTLNANGRQIDFENPYILHGYNLNAKYISKIIFNKKYFNLINFYGKNIKKDENFIKFLNILKNNLNLIFEFAISKNLKSLGFCFNFNSNGNENLDKLFNIAKIELMNFLIQKNKKLKLKIIFND